MWDFIALCLAAYLLIGLLTAIVRVFAYDYMPWLFFVITIVIWPSVWLEGLR